jgi:hypothetical protein
MDFILPFLLRPQPEFQRDRLVDLSMSCLPSESKTQSSPNIPKHTCLLQLTVSKLWVSTCCVVVGIRVSPCNTLGRLFLQCFWNL